jgi:hypothetical protein
MGPYGGLAQDSSCEYLKDRQQNNGDNEPAKNPSAPFGEDIYLLDKSPGGIHDGTSSLPNPSPPSASSRTDFAKGGKGLLIIRFHVGSL